MPGCITHYIFAKDCFDKLDNNNLKNILKIFGQLCLCILKRKNFM